MSKTETVGQEGRAGDRAAALWILGLTLAAALGLGSVVLLGGGAPGEAGPPDSRPDRRGIDPIEVGLPAGGHEPAGRQRVTPPDPGGTGTGTGPEARQSDTLSVEVTGVSLALRPHLGVVFRALVSPPRWHVAPVDAAGIATLHGPLPEQVQLSLAHVLLSDLDLQDSADGSFSWSVRPGGVLRARPEEPIAGVRRATRPDGVTPPLKLACGPEQQTGPAREVQIARRAHLEAAEWLYLWSPDTGGFRMRPADLARAADDLWLADPARGEALARLRLEVPADRVEDARRLHLFLQSGGGEERVYLYLSDEAKWDGAAFRTDGIPAGTWRAEWRSGARTCGVLAEEVFLRAGEETVLTGAPPAMLRWRGEVANWAELPAPVRMRHHLFVSGTLAAVDDEGRFDVELPAELQPAELEIVFREEPGARRLPGRVVTYDSQAGTLAVEHPPAEGFGVVRVKVEPAFAVSGRSIVVLRGLDPRVPTLHLASPYLHGGYRAFVGVREDAVELPRWDPGPLTGALVETVRHDNHVCQQVTAWLSVPPGTERHTVRGRGRSVTLHVHRAAARALVYVQGPADQPALLVTVLHEPGELPLWIAPGTTAVILDLGGGQVERLAPLGDALHVW